MLLNEKTYELVLLTILICRPVVLIHCHGCAGDGSGGQMCRGGDHGCDATVLVAVHCCHCDKGPPSGHVAVGMTWYCSIWSHDQMVHAQIWRYIKPHFSSFSPSGK